MDASRGRRRLPRRAGGDGALICDNHNHLVLTGDADAMVAAAAAAGIGQFAFAEHVFHLTDAIETNRYLADCAVRWSEGPEITVAGYLAAVGAADRRHPEVAVTVGIEFDFVPEVEGLADHTRELTLAHPWDVTLGSVHALADDRSIFESTDEVAPEEAWADYHGRLLAAVGSGLFDVVTHPLRLVASKLEPPADLPDRLDELAGAAASAGVALEVNGSDLRLARPLVEQLIAAVARRGAPVSLGSDAHRPRNVGSVLPAIELLRAAGISEALCFERREAKAEPLA